MKSRLVILSFTILWLAIPVASILPTFSTTASSIGGQCKVTSIQSFGSPITIAVVIIIFETFVFCFNSYRLIDIVHVHLPNRSTLQDRLRTAWTGKDLPELTKGLLRAGQKYYVCVLVLYIASLVLVSTSGLSLTVKETLLVPSITLQNALACRVYREMMFDLFSLHKPKAGLSDELASPVWHNINFAVALRELGDVQNVESDRSREPEARKSLHIV
ncbi:hypothetical protein C8Q75DRAFT_807081 [Abortiporus biennis]|nr:hypothetical protein C8Q75DRAFT_807081 [Abortiporus biennis]